MKKFLSIFLIIGAGLLTGAGFWANHTNQFIENSISQDGTVIALQRSKSKDSNVYHPIVRFITSDNQTIEFRSGLGSNPPRHRVGETIEIIYPPEAPHKAEINSFISLWFGPLIVTILGSVFFLIGFIPLLIISSKARMRKRLQDTGDRILAEFNQVEHNRSVKMNNRSPYQIICQWHNPMEPSKVYVFHSENIWFNPEQFIDRKQIPVYIDRKNPKKYYVDISFLPEMA